jgi:hypothetical protein
VFENIPIGEGEVIHYEMRATASDSSGSWDPRWTGSDAHGSLWIFIYEMNGDPAQLVPGGVYPPVAIPDPGTWLGALQVCSPWLCVCGTDDRKPVLLVQRSPAPPLRAVRRFRRFGASFAFSPQSARIEIGASNRNSGRKPTFLLDGTRCGRQ